MSAVALRLQATQLAGLDEQLCALGPLRLVRSEAGVFLECDADLVDRARSHLARAGARALDADAPTPGRGLVPALARDLDPIRAGGLVDVVWIRPLSAGEASARCVRSPRWRGRADADALRAILQGERTYSWRRLVWAPRHALRRLRSVRPIVFDRGALTRSPERVAFAREGRLVRWAA